MPRETVRARRERAAVLMDRLAALYPDSRCSLDYRNAFELVVATVLSAQCTDAAVNRATPGLFARFPTPQALGAASVEEVEEYIRTLNFYRNKAKSLVGLGRELVERHGGEVPAEMEALAALPGVGRKTANVVLGVGFGIAEGVVVDTHVKRIAARLGLTREEDPQKVELDLLKVLPVEGRVVFTHRIIDHGRAVCTARRTRCESCGLAALCPSASAAGAAGGR